MVPALFLFLATAASPEDAFRAGLLALQRNDLPAALASLEQSAKLAPTNGRVFIALSQTYWKLNDAAKADTAANKAATLAPNDPAVLQALAIYYSESHQILKAAQAQTAYAAKVPQDHQAHDQAVTLCFEAAQPLLNAQKFAEALGVLEPAAKRLPNSAQLELALGVSYYGLRRFDEAAVAFLRTIAIAPETEQPYLFLGAFLDQIPDRLPEISRRAVAFEKAHPADAQAYLLHAKVLDAQSLEPETAVKLLEKSLSLDDRQPAAHTELAGVFDRLQRYADAATEYEKSIALRPSDAAVHYRLARDYDRLGKHDAALAQREIHAVLLKEESTSPRAMGK